MSKEKLFPLTALQRFNSCRGAVTFIVGLLLEPDVDVELFSTHSLLDELSCVEIYFWDQQILLLSYKSQL
jgi:hypothetical protein